MGERARGRHDRDIRDGRDTRDMADETTTVPPANGRRITTLKLADGSECRFAELPTSTALEVYLGDVAGDPESEAVQLHSAIRASLRLAGYSQGDANTTLWLIDFNDKEVVAAVTAAIFPVGRRSES